MLQSLCPAGPDAVAIVGTSGQRAPVLRDLDGTCISKDGTSKLEGPVKAEMQLCPSIPCQQTAAP